MDDLDKKTAVVTGAASGIGRAMCLRFGEAGMNVVLADVDDDKLNSVTDEVAALGVGAIGVHTDVADSAANVALLDATIDEFGQANVVCLNAGVTGAIGRSWALSEEDWDWTLGILVKGVVNGIRAFVPHLIEHGDGHVVTTGSIAGHVSGAFGAPYNVGKHSVVTMTEALYHELKAEDSPVGVTCLCPGFVNTNIVVATTERRNAGLAGTSSDERGDRYVEMSARALAGGLDPTVVGQQVLDAILANQFWLFTDFRWDEAISKRTEEIVGRKAPTIGLPSKG